MARHSHWAKIKRGKAANDAKRGREWSKLARRIIVATKGGGGNPDENLSLRYAIDEARAANMPNDTIDKAIKKGTGELGGASYEKAFYEGYGPGGAAFLIECLTDNRSRTAPEIRNIFERGGGQLGSSNCVAWMFEQKGVFLVPADRVEEDALMELALEAGADDVQREGDVYSVTCSAAAFAALRAALAGRNLQPTSAEITMLPKASVVLPDDKAGAALELMEAFEENDDVQKVYVNFELSDQQLAAVEK